MPRSLTFAAFGIVFAAAALGQPVVNAIENNYSFVPPGLPNYGIAQGSIFVIFGSNLAASNSGLQSVPLKTTLAGVSVQFTVQGVTTQALLYYVMPNQIAGLLPSVTPTGVGTVTVTSGAQSSDPAPVTVVRSAVGLVTLGGDIGPAAAFDTNWRQLSPSFNAAHPGDVIVLYASGLGPVPGDESIQQVPQNLASIPLEVDIGGIPATVTYHGRSIYPGLDQINVVVPPGPVGCNIPVVARSGGFVSNSPMIPIAVGSRVCSEVIPGFLLTVTTSKNSANLGTIGMSATENVTVSGSPSSLTQISETVSNVAGASFEQIPFGSGSTLTTGTLPLPSPGNCIVHTSVTPAVSLPVTGGMGQITNVSPNGGPPPAPIALSAGANINITGPNGKVSLPFQLSLSGYSGPLAPSTGPSFIPDDGGIFIIDNGSGSADIGPFNVQIELPPLLKLSNLSSFTSIDRTRPLTITWTGGNPSGYIMLNGNAFIPGPNGSVGALFQCTAPVSARQFTVPSAVLLALPAATIQTGPFRPSLTIRSEADFALAAPGLDGGSIRENSLVGVIVPYQ